MRKKTHLSLPQITLRRISTVLWWPITSHQQWTQSRDSPRQTRAHRRNSGKCRTFTFLILKSGVVKAHHELGFVARDLHTQPLGWQQEAKGSAEMLIQWHFLRATPGNLQSHGSCSRSTMESARSEDKWVKTSLMFDLNIICFSSVHLGSFFNL